MSVIKPSTAVRGIKCLLNSSGNREAEEMHGLNYGFGIEAGRRRTRVYESVA